MNGVVVNGLKEVVLSKWSGKKKEDEIREDWDVRII